MALSKADAGEGKEEVFGLLEWGCEVEKGAGRPLQLGPEFEVKGSSIQALLFGGEEKGRGVILAWLLCMHLVWVPPYLNL